MYWKNLITIDGFYGNWMNCHLKKNFKKIKKYVYQILLPTLKDTKKQRISFFNVERKIKSTICITSNTDEKKIILN